MNPAIVPLVEGQAEVISTPLLLRRLLHGQERFDLDVPRPIRFRRNKITKEGELARTLAIGARDRPNVVGAIVILDADKDCPVKLANDLSRQAASATHLPVEVVVATCEFEAWLLAGVNSLRASGRVAADARPPEDPERIRDAKGALRQCMPPGKTYHEVGDQPTFVEEVDLAEVRNRCRSFRRLDSALANLLRAIDS